MQRMSLSTRILNTVGERGIPVVRHTKIMVSLIGIFAKLNLWYYSSFFIHLLICHQLCSDHILLCIVKQLLNKIAVCCFLSIVVLSTQLRALLLPGKNIGTPFQWSTMLLWLWTCSHTQSPGSTLHSGAWFLPSLSTLPLSIQFNSILFKWALLAWHVKHCTLHKQFVTLEL